MKQRIILVIDDDLDLRTSVAEVLEEAGFQAVTASNGRDALRLLLEEELHPHLILLDLMMPVMDGWAFRAEQAKNRRLDSIPVVLFSAYSVHPEVVDRMKVAGFLKKPMSLRALLDTVDRFATAASDDEGATAQKRPR